MPNKKSGFTLIEIVIYVAIMGLVLSALIMFFLTIGNNRDKAYSASEVEANAKITLNEISSLIRQARSFDDNNSVYNNDQGVLVLFLDEAKTQVASIDLLNGRVRIQTGFEPAWFVSSPAVSFSRLNFSKLSDQQISLDMSLAFGPLGAEITPEKTYKQNLTTTISIRQ